MNRQIQTHHQRQDTEENKGHKEAEEKGESVAPASGVADEGESAASVLAYIVQDSAVFANRGKASHKGRGSALPAVST